MNRSAPTSPAFAVGVAHRAERRQVGNTTKPIALPTSVSGIFISR